MMKHSKALALFLAFSFVFVLAGISQTQEEETVVCPVTGHKIKKSEAKATYEYKGETYYFCCSSCKEKFMKDPEKYIHKKTEMKEVYTCPMHPEVKSDKPGKCAQCGMKLEKKMMHKEHMEKGCKHEKKKHGEMMHMKTKEMLCCPLMFIKDVEVNVENIEDGITLKIASKDADVVKKIQEMAAKIKTMCKEKAACRKEEAKKKEAKK